MSNFGCLTNDARRTHEIKSRIAMAKAALSKKKALFTSKLNINLSHLGVFIFLNNRLVDLH
jgi:hypothetical protein